MDIQEVSGWLVAAQAVLTFAVGVFAWYLRTQFLTRGDFAAFHKADFGGHKAEVAQRLAAHADRLTIGDGRFQRIEDRLGSVPSSEEIAELKIGMERLHGDLKVTGERLHGLAELHGTLKHQVGIMDDFLRRSGGR